MISPSKPYPRFSKFDEYRMQCLYAPDAGEHAAIKAQIDGIWQSLTANARHEREMRHLYGPGEPWRFAAVWGT